MALVAEDTGVPDEDLIAHAKAGDRKAFAELVARHYDFVFRVAWKWCGRKTDAEDIAQEVCARLGRSIRSFTGQGAFTTWLYALTLNVARDHGRKLLRESRKTAAFGVHAAAFGEAMPEPDERADALWEAVRKLPDKQREAVLLVYGEDLSHGDAAEIMGCAEPTVSWYIHEAKKRLKVHMRLAGEA
ncbi:RNA polymerase sigma factor [Mesorhizobium sp. J428]|uniref:RNA polymerase sigma factor n=1 Tax=Mesorhizobium sp. J428 TaxID=2898440 RepID=UPI002150CEAD|nr:RNA polymerase sigma factor [Mesorhizobium sp. J428]MCR5855286.1 RNA polymerase sigma factor [Mesorhizobium sp. J428]